jgi:hypothetical protein
MDLRWSRKYGPDRRKPSTYIAEFNKITQNRKISKKISKANSEIKQNSAISLEDTAKSNESLPLK